jgi:hypothetical protein
MSQPERPTERHHYVGAPEEQPSNDGAFPYIVWATIAAGLILALISILTRGFSSHAGPAPRHAKPAEIQGTPATVKCIPTPHLVAHFYTFDGPKTAPLTFGPPVDRAHAAEVLRLRLCETPSIGGDQRLWAALDSRINGTNPNAAVTPAQWASYANALVDTQLDWAHAAVQELTYLTPPHTQQMLQTPVPYIQTTAGNTGSQWFLVIKAHQRNGSGTVTLRLRLECGFQPYF